MTAVNFVRKLFHYTLNNVVFGIALMVLVALYIAIGSGLPGVREYFEMNELEFFDTWVLKGLMICLVLSLAVVTWNRIPLTPPRYGVWCIHCGIITLIIGTSLYYHRKFEGRTKIPVNRTAFYYYDNAERALYARVPGGETVGMHPLPSLPRFKSYAPESGNAGELRGKDLKDIQRVMPVDVRPLETRELSKILGLNKPVSMDVTGFYPYAEIKNDVQEDPSSDDVGVEVKVTGTAQDGHDAETGSMILTDSDVAAASQSLGMTEIEHRHVSETELATLEQGARQMLELTIQTPGKAAQKQFVQLGQVYSTADGSYDIIPNAFDPDFTMTSGEHVSTLTLHVVPHSVAAGGSGATEFWRMILQGKTLQTDFKSDPATTPPFVKGNRQSEPLGKKLQLSFMLNDPGRLMPISGIKHTLVTSGSKSLVDIFTTFFTPAVLTDRSAGGAIAYFPDGKTRQDAYVRRVNHVSVSAMVVPTPPARQDKDIAESGRKQVLLVRVRCGDWSREIPVPYDAFPAPDPITTEIFEPWSMGVVRIPGARAPLQLQLGTTCRTLPAPLMLKKLDLVHYAGGKNDIGLMREVSSVMELQDRATGDRSVVVASLNDPVYYHNGQWIFFQAGYDPQGGWTLIGVGNRPGVLVMISGCILIVAGLMYAFYAKPIIIRRMKSAALARAAATRAIAPRLVPAPREIEKVT